MVKICVFSLFYFDRDYDLPLARIDNSGRLAISPYLAQNC